MAERRFSRRDESLKSCDADQGKRAAHIHSLLREEMSKKTQNLKEECLSKMDNIMHERFIKY